MDMVPMLLAALIAAPAGAFAGRFQHALYINPEHRVPRPGLKGRLQPVALAVLAGCAAALAFRPDHYDAGPAFLVSAFALSLLVLASTDIERRLLPNRLMYPSLLAAIAFCWAWPDRDVLDVAIGAGAGLLAGLGLFVLGAFFGSARATAAIPFGFGDAKLIFLLGILLGWPAFGAALLIGVLVAGVPGLAMVLLGRGGAVFSYGPYLAAGGLVVLLFPAGFN
jgi:prepilin signal peptidase PulO-like enzyme (type II secretory pathway)